MKNKRLTASIAGLFVFGGLCLSGNAYALSENGVSVTALRDFELEMTLDANSLVFDITPSTLQMKTITITAHTNNPTGYKVSMNGNRKTDYLTNMSIPTGPKIPNLNGNFSVADFPGTGWGYTIDSENLLFSGIPVNPTNLFNVSDMSQNTHEVVVGVKADDEIPAGVYSNELLFTIVANPATKPVCNPSATHIDDAVCLQDMNENIKASMITEYQYQLFDYRDSKLYYLMKDTNGNVWMTQNLDLDLDKDTTLTYLDTDLNSTETWTPCVNTYTGSLKNKSIYDILNGSDCDVSVIAPVSYDPGSYYFNSNKLIDGSEYNCDDSDIEGCVLFNRGPAVANGEHGNIGNLYSYNAANAEKAITSAGFGYVSATMPDSICPKGWRLPSPQDILNIYGYTQDEYEQDSYDGVLKWFDFTKYTSAPYYFTFNKNKVVESEYHLDDPYVDMIFMEYNVNANRYYDGHMWTMNLELGVDGYFAQNVLQGHVDVANLIPIRCMAR